MQSNAGGYHAGNKTEDDVFSNLTVSNHKPYTQQLQQTPKSTNNSKGYSYAHGANSSGGATIDGR